MGLTCCCWHHRPLFFFICVLIPRGSRAFTFVPAAGRRSSTDLRLGSSAGTTVSGLAHRVHSRSSLDFLNERRGPLRRESGRAQDTFDSPVDVLLEAEADVDVFPVGTKPGEQIDVGLRRQRHSDGLIKHADANDRRPLRLVSRSGSMDGDTNGSGTAGSESSSHGAKRHSRLVSCRWSFGTFLPLPGICGHPQAGLAT